MKKFFTLLVCLSALGVNAADHTYLSLLQGPVQMVVSNSVVETSFPIFDTTASAVPGASLPVNPIIAYTNAFGTGLLANTNYFYYVTNTIAGDTNVTGWRTNLSSRAGIMNPSAFNPVEVWADKDGNSTSLTFSMSYTKAGSAATATNGWSVLLLRSYDGVNYVFDDNYPTLSTGSGQNQTTVQTLSTNLTSDWLTGVKSVKIRYFLASTNHALSTTSSLNVKALGISGHKP